MIVMMTMTQRKCEIELNVGAVELLWNQVSKNASTQGAAYSMSTADDHDGDFTENTKQRPINGCCDTYGGDNSHM